MKTRRINFLVAFFSTVLFFLIIIILSAFLNVNELVLNRVISIIFLIYSLVILNVVLKSTSIFFDSFIVKRKRIRYKTLRSWLYDGAQGGDKIENHLLRLKPKYDFLENLELIRNEIINLGRTKATLYKANLKANQRIEIYSQLIITTTITLGIGLFTWGIKIGLGANTQFDFILNITHWLFYGLIGIRHLFITIQKTVYKNALLIEIIEEIKEDEYSN